nr:hypothetical protein [Tanacetum cinerariifolium]
VKDRWKTNYLPKKVLVDLLHQLPLLRVVNLSNYMISEVPECIGSLKHLRYINLSRTNIRSLPETVCDLYNLQTLIVFGCSSLAKFPNNFSKLKNLRHLDIRDTPQLKDMPLGVGKLKSLQTLSKIIIGGENDFSITQLKDLKNLSGSVSIRGLNNVKEATEAREANLSQKKLNELELKWSGSKKETDINEVLDALKPYDGDLKKLGIVNYCGLVFPKWVGDRSFLRLARVSMRGCKSCTSLPPFGQLTSLKDLSIQDMDNVKVVASEFLGNGVSFPSLEVLSFEGMLGWEIWSTNGRSTTSQVVRDVAFPCLKELHIIVEALPSLRVSTIDGCGDGVLRSVVRVAPTVTRLNIRSISGLTNEVWTEASSKVFMNLRKLEVERCHTLVSLGEKDDEEEYNYGSNLLTSLSSLEVGCCDNLSMGGGHKLKSVSIMSCRKLLLKEKLGGGENYMPMLETLDIYGYPNAAWIIEFGSNFMHLRTLSIRNCICRAESLFLNLQLSSLTSLTTLEIRDCPSMDVPTGLWPPNLRWLSIGRLIKPFSEWPPQKFPITLVHLTLEAGEKEAATNWSQLSHLHLPSSLIRLEIYYFENLETLSEGLQHHTSLQHLSIGGCCYMKDLPEMLFPSLLSLEIEKCGRLNERCSERGGPYWP